MARKIRDLIKELESAGFINRGGKGSHRNFVHPNVIKPLTISGKENDDAKYYQEKAVTLAIKEAKNE
jgi:predicted RNA binding protein YcfA (HicA-like mRNA interferase family)